MRDLPKIVDFDDHTYDPFAHSDASYGAKLDPFEQMAALRKKGPVHEMEYRVLVGEPSAATAVEGMRSFIVVRYEEVHEVLSKPEIYSNKIFETTLGLSFGKTITAMDAPEHTRYRQIFQKAFLPNVVAKWGGTLVDPVVDDLVGNIRGKGEADLVDDFTQHYPFGVIYNMLKLPREDQKVFHKLAVGQGNFYLDPKFAIEAGDKLGAYFEGMLKQRRENPGDDLVSTLAQVEVDGQRLPDDVIVSFLRQLMNAGGDTTFRATSTLLGQLMLNPDQYEAIVKDRSLLSKAIDEVLRWDTPVLMMYRLTTQDTELGGVHIPAGSLVQASQGAANRDPAHFPEPDKFDIFRNNGMERVLRFGTGPHVCIGQHLAKLEMTRAVSALIDRLPNLRLDTDKPAPVSHGSELRSPHHVWVKFDRVTQH